MSIPIAAAVEVAEDIAKNAKDPGRLVGDAVTFFKAYQAAAGASKVGAAVVALDKARLLGPAVDALADVLPVLQAILRDEEQKSELLALLAAL